MSNKLDAFWAAREMLMMEVDRKNDAIRHKFDVAVANRTTFEAGPELPEFVKGPSIEEVLELAKKIYEYIEPSPNKPAAAKLLAE